MFNLILGRSEPLFSSASRAKVLVISGMNLFEFGPGNAHFAYELMPFFTPRCDSFVTAEEDQRQRRGERRAI